MQMFLVCVLAIISSKLSDKFLKMAALMQYGGNPGVIFIIAPGVVRLRCERNNLRISLGYQGHVNDPMVTVGTDRYLVRDVKSPPAVCLPVGRQDRLQCVQKMENMPHSFQIMLRLCSFPAPTPFSPL